MTTWATLASTYGWTVIHIEDGTARVAANTGPDQSLAEQIRDWLTHQHRIQVLLDRHGLVDVPLDELR